MSDEPASPKPEPPDPAITGTASEQKAAKIDACRDMLDRGYTPAQVIAWASRDTVDKKWRVGRTTARGYVDRALEQIDGEVVQPKNRKQARNRGMLTLFARRAYELCVDGEMKHKAAGLITAGVAAMDKINRIDGAYAFDGSSLLPPSVNPATVEDAFRIVAHAQATLELARRRGALVAAPTPPPVIEISESDAEESDEIDEPVTGDAN